MFYTQRILKSVSGTLTDVSLDLNFHHQGSATVELGTSDVLYVGSDLPFNHKYFDVETANDQVAALSVEIWWSNQWVAAVDLLDQTAVGGATLARSGIVQWSTHKDKGWDREDESADVTGLDGTTIYNMYWARFKVSAALKGTTALSFVGHRFSDDTLLFEQYPTLRNTGLMGSFATGKTDWAAQHQVAADFIVRELKTRNIITSPAQILDSSLFTEAAVHKTAHVIFSAFGQQYAVQRDEAIKAYHRAFNFKNYHVDINADAKTSGTERRHSTGFQTR